MRMALRLMLLYNQPIKAPQTSNCIPVTGITNSNSYLAVNVLQQLYSSVKCNPYPRRVLCFGIGPTFVQAGHACDVPKNHCGLKLGFALVEAARRPRLLSLNSSAGLLPFGFLTRVLDWLAPLPVLRLGLRASG